MMEQNKHTFSKEIWRTIEFEQKNVTNKTRYEVSNYGRIRSYNSVSNGRILKGSWTEGYNVLKLKMLRPKTPAEQKQINDSRTAINVLIEKRKEAILAGKNINTINKMSKEIAVAEKQAKKTVNDIRIARSTYLHLMIHKLVAKYFLPPPSEEDIVVGHLDYNRANNHVSNLKWMTHEERIAHHEKSPNVIADKANRRIVKRVRDKGLKLTSTEVIRIKQQLKRNKSTKLIAKAFNISTMQVWRIKTGENWGHIKIPD